MKKKFCDISACNAEAIGNVTYYDEESNELADDDVCMKHISREAVAANLRVLGYEISGRKIVEICINYDTTEYFKAVIK